MYLPAPELSSDLEWMLQSGQATPEMLVEALVDEFYPLLNFLAQAVLADSQAARQAAGAVLATTLVNIHRYHPGAGGVRRWFFRLAADHLVRHGRRPAALEPAALPGPDDELVRLFLRLDVKTRLLLAMTLLPGWNPAEAALLLGLEAEAGDRRLNRGYQALQARLEVAGHIPADYPQGLDTALKQALFARWPLHTPALEERQELIFRAVELAKRGSARRKSTAILAELVLVWLVVMAVTGLWLGGGRFEPQPTATLVPTVTPTPYPTAAGEDLAATPLSNAAIRAAIATLDGRPLPTPTLVTPAPPPQPLEPSSVEIRQRIAGSRQNWHTLWADARLVDHGPPGYAGPANGFHAQVWVSQPSQSLEVVGSLDSLPKAAYLTAGGRNYQYDFSAHTLSSAVNQELLPASVVRDYLFPASAQWFNRPGEFRPVETGQHAGRAALQVQWVNPAGQREADLWVDAVTGVILRLVQYGGEDFSLPVYEWLVNQVAYDTNFAPEQFSPRYLNESVSGYQLNWPPGWNSSWVDIPVRHAPLAEPAPRGFDPSQSRLTFEYQQAADPFGPLDISTGIAVDILAGNILLGTTRLGSPREMICERAPDGKKIAFVRQPGMAAGNGSLYWFDLHTPSRLQAPIPNFNVTSFAFAPDSRRLAVFGRFNYLDNRGIYLVDTLSNSYELLLPVEDARSLVWSPDGQYLAMIGRIPDENVLVVAVDSRQIIYHQPIDYEQNSVSIDWPMANWGVTFPVENGGLEACVAAPRPQN